MWSLHCTINLQEISIINNRIIHVKQSSKPFKIYSTGGILVDRFNEIDFTVSKPDLLSMLGNMLTVLKLK